MSGLDEKGNVMVTGHVLVRDPETEEVFVNKSVNNYILNNVENNYYVYLWLNPLKDYQPFYVGKGKDERAVKHLKECKHETYETAKNKRKYFTVKKIIEAGLEPSIKYYKRKLYEEEAYTLETKLIKEHGRKGIDENGILDNIMLEHFHPPGGKKGMKMPPRSEEHRKNWIKSRTGSTWTEEQKERRRGSGNPMFNRTASDETKAIWSEQRSGKNNPCYGKTGLNHPVFGYRHSEEECQNRSNRTSKSWELTWPDGKVEIVFNLKTFCKVNSLNYYVVYNSRNGFKIRQIK